MSLKRRSWQRKGRRTNCERDGVRHPSHKKHMQEKKNNSFFMKRIRASPTDEEIER